VVESELVHELLESLSVVVGGVEDLNAEAEGRESSNARDDHVEVWQERQERRFFDEHRER